MKFSDNVSMGYILKNIPLYSPLKFTFNDSVCLGHAIGFASDEHGGYVKVLPVDESAWYKKPNEPIWVLITDIETL